jgi:RHS repeat-associated protein
MTHPVCCSKGHLFTGKERDSESGNDYFKYRYYASSMGRWLSPDPSMFTHVDFGNPQSLNLYNYVGNRPLTLTDLDGLCWQGFQWACNIIQRVENRVSGFGFQTDDQIVLHPNQRSQKKVQENRRQETALKDLSKQPFKPIDLQLPPGPYVRRDTIGPTPIPKKPEPPGWYECLTVPGDATAAYRDSMAAYNSAAPASSAPSDDDASANGVGSESIRLNLDGRGYRDQGNYNAAVKFNAAAGALDYGISAVGCGLTR